MTARLRLGDLLVQSRLVTEAQVREALERQKTSGKRLGATLVELGYVTDVDVARTLSHQLSVPWVNLLRVDFSRELLSLVSAELAIAARALPVYVRRVRDRGDVLFVATDDPLNEAALGQLAAHVGMPVKAMVASARDVSDALRVYYGHLADEPGVDFEEDFEVEVDAPVSVVQSRNGSDDAPAMHEPGEQGPAQAGATSAAPSTPSESSPPSTSAEPAPTPTPEPTVAQRPRSSAPHDVDTTNRPHSPSGSRARARPSRPKMVTLTLLDGTKVTLPARGSDDAGAEAHLTSRDLVQALMLLAEGKDVSAVLPDARWEPLLATLLSLLLRKGLVADWEFVEEWKKLTGSRGSNRE